MTKSQDHDTIFFLEGGKCLSGMQEGMLFVSGSVMSFDPGLPQECKFAHMVLLPRDC